MANRKNTFRFSPFNFYLIFVLSFSPISPMRKHIFLLILLCSLLPAAAVPDSPRSFVDRGRGLFESGRWADARHEFLAARRLLSPEQLSEARLSYWPGGTVYAYCNRHGLFQLKG